MEAYSLSLVGTTNPEETRASMERLEKYVKETSKEEIINVAQVTDTESDSLPATTSFIDPARPAKYVIVYTNGVITI